MRAVSGLGPASELLKVEKFRIFATYEVLPNERGLHVSVCHDAATGSFC